MNRLTLQQQATRAIVRATYRQLAPWYAALDCFTRPSPRLPMLQQVGAAVDAAARAGDVPGTQRACAAFAAAWHRAAGEEA